MKPPITLLVLVVLVSNIRAILRLERIPGS